MLQRSLGVHFLFGFLNFGHCIFFVICILFFVIFLFFITSGVPTQSMGTRGEYVPLCLHFATSYGTIGPYLAPLAGHS